MLFNLKKLIFGKYLILLRRSLLSKGTIMIDVIFQKGFFILRNMFMVDFENLGCLDFAWFVHINVLYIVCFNIYF